MDRVFVGQALNPDALAGITMAFPYMLVLLAAAMLIGFGAAAQVSIKLGEKKTDEAERVLGNAALLLLLCSVVLTVVGLAAAGPGLRGLGISPDVLPYTHDYLQIVIFATGFQLVGLRAQCGDPGRGQCPHGDVDAPDRRVPEFLSGLAIPLQIPPMGNLEFLWGMRGAALATAIAQGVSAAWVLAYFLRGKSLMRLHWRYLRFHGPTCRPNPADRLADVPHAAFRRLDVRAL